MAKKKPGPAPKPIDEKLVEGMASVGATIEEIADFCGVSRDTIERRFLSTIHRVKAQAKFSLRQAQLRAALKGNPAMLIWLGKSMLGQTEKTQVEHTGSEGGPLTVKVVYEVIDPRPPRAP